MDEKKTCTVCKREIDLCKVSKKNQVMLFEYHNLSGESISHYLCCPLCSDSFPSFSSGCVICNKMCYTQEWFVTIANPKESGFFTWKASCSETCSHKIAAVERKKNNLYNICRNCSKLLKTGTLWKCSKCRRAYYCNRVCQKADWAEHKKECS